MLSPVRKYMASSGHCLNFTLWRKGVSIQIRFFNRAFHAKLLLDLGAFSQKFQTCQCRYFDILSPKRCNHETRTGSARKLSGIRQSWWLQNTFPRGKKSGKRSWALEWSHVGTTVSYKGSLRKVTFRVSGLLDSNFPAEVRNSFRREDFLETVVLLISNCRENPSLAGCRSVWLNDSTPLPSKTHNVFSQAVSGSKWSNLRDGVCMISEPNTATGVRESILWRKHDV